MENTDQLGQILSDLLPVIIAVAIWEIIWKLIALWKAARNGQFVWFIALAIVNSAGILPIIYILTYRNKALPE